MITYTGFTEYYTNILDENGYFEIDFSMMMHIHNARELLQLKGSLLLIEIENNVYENNQPTGQRHEETIIIHNICNNEIADEYILNLVSKTFKLKPQAEFNEKWKERYNACFDKKENQKIELNNTRTELSDIRSRFSTIESLYNSTIDDINEKQHTIDKLTQELNTATKRIEELESRDFQFQGSSSDESSNDDETSNEPNDEPVEPVELPTMSITLPNSMSLDNTDRTIDLYTYGTNNIRIDTYYPDTGTKYHINDKADITIYRDTEITNRQFIATNQDSYCYVGDLIVGQDPSIPISVQHTNSLQLQFRESNDISRCDQAPNVLFNDKLSLNKEVYVRFVGTDGQIPFYYTNEIVEILKCTADNFDDNTDTLLDNTEICYGKSGSDIVIVSKILAVFGI